MNIEWKKQKRDKPKKGRSVKMQALFSDRSGHGHILTMIEKLYANNWTQPELVFTAFQLLHDAWIQKGGGQLYPLSPTPSYITEQMEGLVQAANNALEQANEILGKVASGALSAQNGDQIAHYQDSIRTMQNQLSVDVIEGAANFSSEAYINDDDSTDEWE